MSTLITLIFFLYRAVSVLSLFVTLPLPPLSLFRDLSPLRLGVCVLLRRGGDMPAWFQFRGLHFYVHLFWSVRGLNLWISRGIHPIFDKKEVRIFPCCLHLCVVILVVDFSDVHTFISVPRWHTACLINMASLDIYLCGRWHQRVSFIYQALFVSSLLIDKYTCWMLRNLSGVGGVGGW